MQKSSKNFLRNLVANGGVALLIPCLMWAALGPTSGRSASEFSERAGSTHPTASPSPTSTPGPFIGMPQDSKAKVRRVWLGLGYLEEKGANKLTRKQAQSFVALVAPWRKRPNMSRCEAKRLAGQIMSVLTPPQAQELRASPMNCESPKANTTEFIPSERKAESWASWLPPTTPSNPEYFEGRNRIFAEIQAIRAGENLFFPPESGIEMQKLPPHQRAEFTENYRLALKVLHQLERKTIF